MTEPSLAPVSPPVVSTRAELAAALAGADAAAAPGLLAGRRAVVMTMGALHAGHGSLISRARGLAGRRGQVIVTIFVNPLQFGANEDLATYPRTLQSDLELCRELGVDLIFAPSREEMYPGGDPKITVNPGELGMVFEGKARPTHFSGVLTVVARLLGLTRPDLAIFGEKDYQQLVLIRRMVRDLELGVQVVGAPIVRDPDGLALSSRNAYLTPEQRRAALAVPRAIAAGVAAAQAGADAAGVEAAARAELAAGDGAVPVAVDYAGVTDLELGPAPTAGAARLLIAVNVGAVRLLDNAPVELTAVDGSTTNPDLARA